VYFVGLCCIIRFLNVTNNQEPNNVATNSERRTSSAVRQSVPSVHSPPNRTTYSSTTAKHNKF